MRLLWLTLINLLFFMIIIQRIISTTRERKDWPVKSPRTEFLQLCGETCVKMSLHKCWYISKLLTIKLEKCRFCDLGFTVEPFCQSRRMLSTKNMSIRLMEIITNGGNSGVSLFECMEHCRDNTDCEVNFFDIIFNRPSALIIISEL